MHYLMQTREGEDVGIHRTDETYISPWFMFDDEPLVPQFIDEDEYDRLLHIVGMKELVCEREESIAGGLASAIHLEMKEDDALRSP